MHSHWGTKRGYVLQTPEELAQQRATWHSDPDYKTEDEMAAYFRANDVRVILDLGFSKFLPLDEMQSLHDYSFATERAHRDVILGHWFHIDPGMGSGGVKELRRCIDNRVGFVGYAGVGFQVASGQRSVLRAVLQIVHRSWHSDSVLRRHHRAGCRPSRRRRRHSRQLPSAPSRSGRGALSRAENHGRPPGLAVADRNACRADAQAQHLVRAARLVAEISRRRSQARHSAAAERPRHVRRRLSVVRL